MKRLQMTQSKMNEMMRRMDMLESKNVTFCTWKQVDGLIKNTSEEIKADIVGDFKEQRKQTVTDLNTGIKNLEARMTEQIGAI